VPSPRAVIQTASFTNDLNRLDRKYRGVADRVERELADWARMDEPCGNRIPGMGGRRVYKHRCAGVDGRGKRGGLRIIYLWDETRLVALFVYAKTEWEDVQPKEIAEALRTIGL
jgi:mRNA-degrading endonuclease RelE of RelBE toxin-antitoxin system